MINLMIPIFHYIKLEANAVTYSNKRISLAVDDAY